ncbi:MAG: hypothetical protein ACXVEC_05715, partial [Nocardioides sp.]
MTEDRGLSIFDEEQAGGEESPTQVLPQVKSEPKQEGQAQAPKQGQQPAAAAPTNAPQAAAARPAAATPAAATPAAANPTAANLPLVRRGGYDKDAVDRHLRTTAAEKAGLLASLQEAQGKLKVLEAQVSGLRERLAENEKPSYAGLGGKASEMLRLAEEQAEDVIHEANLQAAEVRKQAAREAEAIKAAAESDADDMRLVQLG